MPRQQSKERNTEYKRQWRKNNLKRARQAYKRANKKRKLNGTRKPPTDEQKRENVKRTKAWVEANRERRRAWDRARYQKAKVKKLKKYLTQIKYERLHPGRSIKYYNENREAILAQQKTRRNGKAQKSK
jgi:hypothetical protein